MAFKRKKKKDKKHKQEKQKNHKIIPNFTQIGSLPFDNVNVALNYSLQHSIPFLPELTRLGDGMFEYIRHPGRLSCLKEFHKQKFDKVKIQCIGPITLSQDPSLGYSLDKAMANASVHIDVILQGLDAKEIILFLDEPALGTTGMDFNEYWQMLFEPLDVIRGVHCCGLMQWDLLLKSDTIDIISFDASKYDISIFYKKRNKKIAWGITQQSQIRDLKKGDLITPPCGLSHYKYTEEHAYSALQNLEKIAKKYKR